MDDWGKWRLNSKMFTLEDELLFVLGPQINPFRGTLIFTNSAVVVVGSDDVIANGGFGLVDTGVKKLLVTCHHVWKGFLLERGKNPNARMYMCLHGKPAIAFDKYAPIDQDASLDIATFDATPLLGVCDEHKFYPLHQNPAPRIAVGDRLVLLGDPGQFRSLTDEGLTFGVITYSVGVSSVISDMRFRANVSSKRSKYVQQPVRVSKSGQHGGISGSPCFLVRENRPSQLVGFVTDNFAVQGTDNIYFTHASCLNSDGKINTMPT